MTGGLAVIGSINLDRSAYVARLPRPGETIASTAQTLAWGGKGANQAVAAARLGAPVRMIGAVGDDVVGADALAELRAAGVDVAGVRVASGEPTGQAFICVSAEGENTIVVSAGANAALTPADADAALGEGAALILCQCETPFETIRRALSHPQAARARKLLNAAPAEPWARELTPLCDLLIVNETELAVLAGEAVDGREPARAAARLGLRTDQALAVTLGADGAAAWSGGVVMRVAARHAMVVDTTGAGDCFCGALAARLLEGAALPEALAFASVAASLSVERAGAQAGLPRRAEVERALASVGIAHGAA